MKELYDIADYVRENWIYAIAILVGGLLLIIGYGFFFKQTVQVQMITYIIKTKSGEFYSGKTNDIENRLTQHKKENKPHWFAFKDRKNWIDVVYFNGDYEKKIKRAGVKLIYDIINRKHLHRKNGKN